ncbi:MAG TPA: outer membrane beta-barrel protein [Steroidobacteraceae bacterium]|nr:outer membrane beta-barrel protein [Steroidobacteraceae bacterium]
MRLLPSALLCAGLAASAAAHADDLLGLYVGAGVGQSTLKQDYYQIDSHTTGWKVLAGWRPISVVGAEVEYVGLGSKSVTYQSLAQTIDTKAHATALFAVGYLPVPLPYLDLYAKLGAARVQNDTTVTSFGLPGSTVLDNNRTSFAWGAGAQFKFGLPAIKVEYERFDGSQGNDSLISAALTLNF